MNCKNRDRWSLKYRIDYFSEDEKMKIATMYYDTRKELIKEIKKQLTNKTISFDVVLLKVGFGIAKFEARGSQIWFYDHKNDSLGRYNINRKNTAWIYTKDSIQLQKRLEKIMKKHGR